MFSVDLNSDLGESFGVYVLGHDEDVMKSITSANIACGFHAGDPQVMLKTVQEAVVKGVAVELIQVIRILWDWRRENGLFSR